MTTRTWVDTEIVTAANVQAFLQNQAVISCTSGTRPVAPAEPWMVAETDTDSLNVYDGAAWRRLPGTTMTPILSLSRTTPLTVVVPPVTGPGDIHYVSWETVHTNSEGWTPVATAPGQYGPLVGGIFMAWTSVHEPGNGGDLMRPRPLTTMAWSISDGSVALAQGRPRSFGIGELAAGEPVGLAFGELFGFTVTYTASLKVVRLAW